MACTINTIQTDACESGIGKVQSPVALLQAIAQLSADYLLEANPAADVSAAAIHARACTSGIAKINDPQELMRIIAQVLCDQQA